MKQRPLRVAACRCRGCGAPIEFEEGGREASCEFCGAQNLAEMMGTPPSPAPAPAATGNSAIDTGRLLAVQTLDRDWLEAREKWVRRGPSGEAQIPKPGHAKFEAGTLFALTIGGAILAGRQALGLGITIGIFGTMAASARYWYESTRTGGYARAQFAYQRRRRAILDGSYPVDPTGSPAPLAS